MERSWLVQRLRRPQQPTGGDNPFAFGGGLRNGGLTADAMDLLRDVFTFDYMGAAEFEFGAVPEALASIAEDIEKYITANITVPTAAAPRNWRDGRDGEPDGQATIWIIARAEQLDEVAARINTWAREEINDLKETTRLASTVRPYHEWDGEVCGWLELDNGFFFTDREMWLGTATLFGIAADEPDVEDIPA